MGTSGGHPGRRRRRSTLHGDQTSIGQGVQMQGRSQAPDRDPDGLRRRFGKLGQGIVERQQIEQQLKPRLGTA
jgi:hypothetical protein